MRINRSGCVQMAFNMNRNQIVHTTDHAEFYPIIVIYYYI